MAIFRELLMVCGALLLCAPPSLAQCPATGANSVEMKFYRASTDEFGSDNGESDVVVQIINQANNYCPSQSLQCGLISCCNPFKDTDVTTVIGYPKDEKKDMLHKVYMIQPDNTTCAIKKEYLMDIIERARESIHDATGYWITYIGDEFYGIPPPTKLNSIIIPVAVVLLILLAVMTIVLYKLSKKRDAKERRERILMERNKAKKAKAQPAYTTHTSEIRPGHELETPHTNSKPKRKDQLYKENLRKSLLMKKTSSIASEDSAIKVDSSETTRQRQGYSFENRGGATGYDQPSDAQGQQYNHLKPIEMGNYADNESAGTIEKKKKKKKKKSKSRETVTEGYTESYEDTL